MPAAVIASRLSSDVEVVEPLEAQRVLHAAVGERAAEPEPIRLPAFREQPHRDAGAALPRAEYRQLSQQPKPLVCHAVARRAAARPPACRRVP